MSTPWHVLATDSELVREQLLRQVEDGLEAAIRGARHHHHPFAVGDKADLATLSGILPVRRATIVVGRYLFALGGFALAQIVGLLAAHLPGGADPAGAAWLLSVVPLGVGMLLIATSCAVSVLLYGRRRP
jgi:hypothetical protein